MPMEKYTLTAAGLKAFTAKLYQFSDKKLQAEAVLITRDPREYIAAHFEIPVQQLEYLRNINENFMLIMGWSLAVAVLSRRPVTFAILSDNALGNTCEDACILVSAKLASHITGGVVASTGSLDIQI